MCVSAQAVRPHAPLIKFPNRQDVPRPNGKSVYKKCVRFKQNQPAEYVPNVYVFTDQKHIWFILAE